MKQPILLSLVLFSLTPVVSSTAQQTLDSQRTTLATHVRLTAFTQTDLKELLSKAQSGNAEAQFWLGKVYEEGRLVPRDADESASWFLKSAEQGYCPAQRMLGLINARSNPPVGERWLLRAAEQGDAVAQFWLGFAYENNWFGTTDSQEALKWYKKAAEGGDPDAQVVLGQKYEDGEGVEQNYELAAQWYRRAAEHAPDLGGAGQGRNDLGVLYMRGLGVPQDYVQAYMWFSLKGSEGNAAEAKVHLTPAQIREAERLIREWKEHHRLIPEEEAPLHIEKEL